MSAAALGVWVALLGAIVMGGWRVLRVLVAIIKSLEAVSDLSRTFTAWTADMREWQRGVEGRLVRLETLQEVDR